MMDEKKQILYVEDSTDFQFYIETMLKDVVDVISVSTQKEAREALEGIKFDMFLLDLVLPDGSGSRMSKELKTKYPNTPIVILSAHDIVSDFIEGADATFVKTTLDFDDFVKQIKKLLDIK